MPTISMFYGIIIRISNGEEPFKIDLVK